MVIISSWRFGTNWDDLHEIERRGSALVLWALEALRAPSGDPLLYSPLGSIAQALHWLYLTLRWLHCPMGPP